MSSSMTCQPPRVQPQELQELRENLKAVELQTEKQSGEVVELRTQRWGHGGGQGTGATHGAMVG